MKMDLLRNALQSGDFRDTGFFFTCGRTKTEVFEYNNMELKQPRQRRQGKQEKNQ